MPVSENDPVAADAPPDPRAARERFENLAGRYDRHAALEQEVSRRLLERCAFSRLQPTRVLDLGCGTGAAAAALKRRYRRAQVIGVDASPAMLAGLRRRSSLLRPLRGVCGDVAALPFPRGSADLLFANLVNFWSPQPAALFDEYRRVLRPDGMLLFTTLGPGTFWQLREAWASVDREVTLPAFADILGVGDALMAAGFREPVMDMEVITLQYPRFEAMAEELEATAVSLLIPGWERWRAQRDRLEAAYSPLLTGGSYPLSYEIVYGTAFGPQEGQPRRTAGGDVVTFSVDSLLKSRPMG
jgi:malonyl-CoA O-methyltransferase